MGKPWRLDIPSSRRSAAIIALLVMSLVGALRQVYVTPEDVERIAVLGEFTGIDFGDLPAWFASGAGGDGEVFAVIAADPLGVGPAHLIRGPVYRYTMVGFPWLAWLLALGRQELILVAMSAIGLVSVGAMAFVAVRQRDHLGARSWLLVLNPALILGFLGDSSEPLALLLLTLAFTMSTPWVAVFLAAVRPPFLTGLADMTRKLLIGLGVAVVIRLLASWRFEDSFFYGSHNLGAPFAGFAAAPSLLGFGVIIAAVVTLVLGVRAKSASWILSGLLVTLMSAVVFDTPLNAVRAAGVLPVLWAFGTGSSSVSSEQVSD